MIVENFEEIRVLGLDFTVSRVLIKCFFFCLVTGKNVSEKYKAAKHLSFMHSGPTKNEKCLVNWAGLK